MWLCADVWCWQAAEMDTVKEVLLRELKNLQAEEFKDFKFYRFCRSSDPKSRHRWTKIKVSWGSPPVTWRRQTDGGRWIWSLRCTAASRCRWPRRCYWRWGGTTWLKTWHSAHQVRGHQDRNDNISLSCVRLRRALWLVPLTCSLSPPSGLLQFNTGKASAPCHTQNMWDQSVNTETLFFSPFLL